jgi:hypothetical protein
MEGMAVIHQKKGGQVGKTISHLPCVIRNFLIIKMIVYVEIIINKKLLNYNYNRGFTP